MIETQTPISYERDLVELFSKFTLPQSILDMMKAGISPIGSLSLTKMYYFAAKVGLNNQDYNTIMAIKPAKQEGETYEYYKKRLKFQKFLGKYKPYFFDYYEEYDLGAKKRKLAARKAKRQLI
jgi:hypothetical protein